VGPATVLSDGLPQHSATGEAFDAILLDIVGEAFSAMPPARRRDNNLVIDTVRIAVRRHADVLWGKKPICRVIVHRV
jgi:ribonuclease J